MKMQTPTFLQDTADWIKEANEAAAAKNPLPEADGVMQRYLRAFFSMCDQRINDMDFAESLRHLGKTGGQFATCIPLGLLDDLSKVPHSVLNVISRQMENVEK